MDLFFIFKFSVMLQIVLTKATKDQIETRISYGMTAIDAQFPYQGHIIYGGGLLCGASIIHSRWALTAAHCVEGRVGLTFTVGTIYINGADGTSYAIETTISHPNYQHQPGPLFVIIYDIALLRLASDIQFDYKVQPIPLARDTLANYDHQMAVLTGWGATQSNGQMGTTSTVLLYTYLPILPFSDCQAASPDTYLDNDLHLCGSNVDSQQPCKGDSGGPLVLNGEQIGIVSGAKNSCAGDGPSFFAKVSTFIPWIQSNMAAYNDYI